jgi:cyclophilin family peptidyl-prolyl cis-trans isomerase
VILAACSLTTVEALPTPAAEPGGVRTGVKAVLELSRQFYYAGDPLDVRISIGNDGDQEAANPVKAKLLASFQVRAKGGALLKAGTIPGDKEPQRPDRLAPKGFYGAIVDLASMFAELRKPGTYEISWSADGIESQTIEVRLIPKYDPAKDYVARVETDEGTFTIEFFKKVAPLATKSFVDMANAAFYDGLLIHEVHRDWYIVGGDPQGDGSGNPPFRYPAEPTSLPIVAGTVLMKPVSPSPPTNGCQFIVALRPEPSWKGQATIVGQVSEGLDVVRKIANLPNSERNQPPFFKPLKDVRIRRISVAEKTAPTPGS